MKIGQQGGYNVQSNVLVKKSIVETGNSQIINSCYSDCDDEVLKNISPMLYDEDCVDEDLNVKSLVTEIDLPSQKLPLLEPTSMTSSANSSASCSPVRITANITETFEKENFTDDKRYELQECFSKSLDEKVRLYTAKDRNTGETVVIKTSPKAFRTLEDPVEEVRVMAELQTAYGGFHPSICGLHKQMDVDESVWTVLEYAKCGDMLAYLKNFGQLEEKLARKFFIQILDAIEFIHNHGYCHLDISLENILLMEESCNGDQIAKLCDFGLAKKFNSGNSDSFPRPRFFLPGKKSYMAPEIYQRKPFKGKLADCFSLGVVLFAMLMGMLPYETPCCLRDKCFEMAHCNQVGSLCKKYEEEYGKNIPSDEAIDLMQKMLAPAERRIKLAKIRAHAWMKLSSD